MISKQGALQIGDNVYGIFYYEDNHGTIAYDITDGSRNTYTRINTHDSIASYIDKRKIYIKGKKSLIDTAMKIISDAIHSIGISETRTEKENGIISLVVEKKNPELGIEMKTTTIGLVKNSEFYKTNDGMILFGTIDVSNKQDYSLPINIIDYTTPEFTKGIVVKNKTSGHYSYQELLRMYPQVSHVLKEDYGVCQSLEEAEEKLKQWIESDEPLKSYDIESRGTEWGVNSENGITGVFLGVGEHWSWYFPVDQDNFEFNLPKKEWLTKICDAIDNQPPMPKVTLLAHNVKFELEGFYHELRRMPRFDIDTYLLAVLADPMIKKGTHTLKALTSKCDGRFYLTLEQIFIGAVQFNVLPPEIVKLYGCPDATSPAKIYKMLMKKIPKDESYVISLEMRLPPIKAMNEYYGLPIDMERLDTLLNNVTEDEENLKLLFQKAHKTSENINSYPVLRDILYNKLQAPVKVFTNKGLPSTSKDAIDYIVSHAYLPNDQIDSEIKVADIKSADGHTILKGDDLKSNKYPSLLIYQKYKLLGKERGALERIKSHSRKNRFMFYINQSGAGSNRQTSDAHQFNDTMKSCVVADSPHHGLVSCDWKQVELRVLAWLAGQQDLIKLESDPDVDIHRAILSIIQGKPMYMISEEDRKKGKSVNFGVVYMMTEYGLAARDFGPGYTKENLIEERKKITDFFNGLPYIKNFLSANENFLRTNGYIKTAFHYYRYFPQLLDPTLSEKKKTSIVRSGNNTPVQGTAAQMLKIVECNVWDYICKKGWDKPKNYDGEMLPMVRMMLPIHDEILLSYDKSIPKEEIITMFKECMELDIKDAPPFFAAPAFINNWYDGKDAAYEVDIPFRDMVVENYRKGILTFNEDNYLDVLNNYRNNELASYMNNLFAKYNTPEEVAKHVTHDSLTHTLIETLLPKGERKKLTHEQRILEACKRYKENNKITTSTEKVIDAEAVEWSEEDSEWLEHYVQVTSEGDLVDEYSEDESEEGSLDYNEDINDLGSTEVVNSAILYVLDSVIISLDDLNVEQMKSLNDEICKLHSDENYYKLVYVGNGKTHITDIKLGYIQNVLEDLYEKAKGKE